MLQNGRQFLKRLKASHRGPGRPPSQEQAQEKQNVHGRPAVLAAGHPAPAADRHGQAVERSSATRVLETPSQRLLQTPVSTQDRLTHRQEAGRW